jgi:DNA-binding IclR family transcriptional regulator
MGSNLEEAARTAVTIRATANLGERSAEILQFVNANPQGVRPGEVAKALGGFDAQEAGTYLGRLYKAGKVRKAERGLYTPVETVESVETEMLPQVDGDNE